MKHKFNRLHLKAVIAASGHHHKQVAAAMGVAPSTVSRWVNGKSIPSPDVLHCLFRAIGWGREQVAAVRLVDFYPMEESDEEE